MATEHSHKFNQDEFTHQPHADEHPEQREHSDVRIAPLAWSLAALVVTTLFTLGLIYSMIRGFEFWEARQPESQRRSALDARPEALPAGVPPLQGVAGPADQPRFHGNTPAKDMIVFRRENEELAKYGAKGVYPIEQAMKLALERDIFAKDAQLAKQPAPAPTGGNDANTRRPTDGTAK